MRKQVFMSKKNLIRKHVFMSTVLLPHVTSSTSIHETSSTSITGAAIATMARRRRMHSLAHILSVKRDL
jgi:hypothetical protein